MSDLTVIGIDPGSRNTGWGVVRERSGVLALVACGVVRPPTEGGFADRLAVIFRELVRVLDLYGPSEAAVEQVFGGINVATALKLGQARGAACVACADRGLPVSDYEPRTVKRTLVGTGGAEKAQVAFMVGRLLGVRTDGLALDTTDALGIAICHLTQRRLARKLQQQGEVPSCH